LFFALSFFPSFFFLLSFFFSSPEYFYFQIYTTKDCTGPFSTNATLNREEDCTEEYTNMMDEVTRFKCVASPQDSCKGSVELVTRSGGVMNGVSYQLFGILAFVLICFVFCVFYICALLCVRRVA
jgi:hypothetical protein